jgi:hypothetical protein
MGRLAALAFACDRTRVLTYMFTCPGANAVFSGSLGHTRSMHDLAHTETDNQPLFNQGVIYAMKRLASFLTKLKETPDLTGNLLDNSCIYVTSDLGNGFYHSTSGHPVLIAGKAGGALKGDVHFSFANKENVNRVLFTLMQVMGLRMSTFGAPEIAATQEIRELLPA